MYSCSSCRPFAPLEEGGRRATAETICIDADFEEYVVSNSACRQGELIRHRSSLKEASICSSPSNAAPSQRTEEGEKVGPSRALRGRTGDGQPYGGGLTMIIAYVAL